MQRKKPSISVHLSLLLVGVGVGVVGGGGGVGVARRTEARAHRITPRGIDTRRSSNRWTPNCGGSLRRWTSTREKATTACLSLSSAACRCDQTLPTTWFVSAFSGRCDQAPRDRRVVFVLGDHGMTSSGDHGGASVRGTAFSLSVSTAFAVKTVPLLCVFHCLRDATTVPLLCMFPLHSWMRHCLCLAFFHCLRG